MINEEAISDDILNKIRDLLDQHILKFEDKEKLNIHMIHTISLAKAVGFNLGLLEYIQNDIVHSKKRSEDIKDVMDLAKKEYVKTLKSVKKNKIIVN